jgi:hypothetical protein
MRRIRAGPNRTGFSCVQEGMHRLLAVAAVALGVCFAAPAHAEKAEMTVTSEGHDLRVVVRGATDYCATNAKTDIIRRGNSIRIVRDRPSRVSRCFTKADVTVVVHDVPAGVYTITYEQIPLVAPARALTLASTTSVVSE